jgi:hypothetical protein
MMKLAVVVCPGPDWKPGRGVRCAACGRQLTGKLTWFCRSPAWCRTVYLANHDWTMAKGIALRRSGDGYKRMARCIRSNCEHPVLEVNHITPRNGGGYQLGCHHHQDNLEVLCHDHHREVTAEQRSARAAQAAVLL